MRRPTAYAKSEDTRATKDIVDYLQTLYREIGDLESKVNDLESTVEDLESRIRALENK